jgi:hypothetical protein
VVSHYSIKGKCSSLYVHAAEENGENTHAGKKKGQAWACRGEETAKPQIKRWQTRIFICMMMTWLHEKLGKSYSGDLLFSYRR